jgi:hypothetical protein
MDMYHIATDKHCDRARGQGNGVGEDKFSKIGFQIGFYRDNARCHFLKASAGHGQFENMQIRFDNFHNQPGHKVYKCTSLCDSLLPALATVMEK